MINELLVALHAVVMPANFACVVIGLLIGVMGGALPGFTATMAVSVLVPLTFTMSPVAAMGMIAGIYTGSMYGGSIPAVLLRIPGTPSAIATVFDGYPMARAGRASDAIRLACWGSAAGSTAGALSMLLLSPPLASLALSFGPAEVFWVALIGLISIALLVEGSPTRGLMSAAVGVMFGTVGIDAVSGHERLTFGDMHLVGGINIIVALIGFYTLPSVIAALANPGGAAAPERVERLSLTAASRQSFIAFLGTYWRTLGRSSVIGIIVGILPGIGGNVASILAYNDTKRSSKQPESFGHGNPQGVVAAETANNADSGSSFIPTLTLGIPGSAVTTVVLGALLVHGLRPGPQLFRDNPEVAYGIMLQMLLAAILLPAFGGLAVTRLFARIADLPHAILMPLVLALCTIGAYAVSYSTFDLYLLCAMGVLGFLMERSRIPVAPAVIAMVLGGVAEYNLRLALTIGRGNPSYLADSPISMCLIALIVAVVGWSAAKLLIGKNRTLASADG